MLASRARGAVDVDLEVLIADLDVDLLVHHGVHEDRREARVPARLGVEGGDPHEAMHARLGSEEPEGVFPLHLEHRTLDPRLFPFGEVEDVDRVALPLRPARVHAHEHLRPVLGLGAARAGADLHLRVAEVVSPLEQ